MQVVCLGMWELRKGHLTQTSENVKELLETQIVQEKKNSWVVNKAWFGQLIRASGFWGQTDFFFFQSLRFYPWPESHKAYSYPWSDWLQMHVTDDKHGTMHKRVGGSIKLSPLKKKIA